MNDRLWFSADIKAPPLQVQTRHVTRLKGWGGAVVRALRLWPIPNPPTLSYTAAARYIHTGFFSSPAKTRENFRKKPHFQ
jgi:hypothetical protein